MSEHAAVSPRPREVTLENKIPSQGTWDKVIASAHVGENIFPLSLFAQTIMAAASMIRESEREGFLLSQFALHNPSRDQITQTYRTAKVNAHKKVKIDTIAPHSTPAKEDNTHVWLWYYISRKTRGYLANLGREVLDLRLNAQAGDGKGLGDIEVLNRLQGDPLFYGMVTTAADSLTLPETDRQAQEYQRILIEFYNKYPRYKNVQVDPAMYESERDEVVSVMKGCLASASELSKNTMRKWLRTNYPQEKNLAESLDNTRIKEIFGDTDLQVPNILSL